MCKVFDMFTPFSVGLFYLLYRCFEKVCLFKPVTSRPANSERYVAIVMGNRELKITCVYSNATESVMNDHYWRVLLYILG